MKRSTSDSRVASRCRVFKMSTQCWKMQTLLINAEKKRVSRLETAAAALGLPALIPRQGAPSPLKSPENPERAAAPGSLPL